MLNLNHFLIGSILNSEIVGQMPFGAGQIASSSDGQRYLDALSFQAPPAVAHQGEVVKVSAITRAFLAVRKVRDDRGSPDLYVADPVRNQLFLAKCRELGVTASDYTINKTLLSARKNKNLPDLNSVRTSIDYDEFAFASEFAATDLRYKTGATIEDILCDPALAARFDSTAAQLAPGYTSFDYRWAALSIRKAAGRQDEPPESFKLPKWQGRFRLTEHALTTIPKSSGVYLISEDSKPIYARSTTNLRQAIEAHANPMLLAAIAQKLWIPDPKLLVVNYVIVRDPRTLKAAEKKIIEESRPIFNILQSAE